MKAEIASPRRFFLAVTAKPKTVLALGILFFVLFAVWLPQTKKDTSADAFIPPDHPALQLRDRTKRLFGLEDPLVIAVVNNAEHGVFNPHTLGLVKSLTEQIKKLPQFDPERITSIATENNIVGTTDGMLVKPFFDRPPADQDQADRIRAAVMDFPLYLGSLVARNGQGALIVTEMRDSKSAREAYDALMALTEQAPITDSERLYVAGEGAVSGYMGAYIDADAARLNPIAALIISVVCLLAFRTWRGVLIPNLVVLATVASALGSMAAFGVSFFVITNALPVVLIGISVADSIHILSEYYQRMAENPGRDARTLVVDTMVAMWRPVTLTSLTTMAGFWGIGLASTMPPMRYFGLFAFVGVSVAWVYSLLVVPALMSIFKPKPSRAYRAGQGADGFGKALTNLGEVVVRFPKSVIALTLIAAVTAGIAALRVELDQDRMQTFDPAEAISIADKVLNGLFDGSNYLDVLIETPSNEALFKTDNLRRIAELQRFVETLPHVGGSVSIVDYLKQMNRALHEGRREAYRLPEDANLIAQYFLLYSSSGNPDDFKEEVDYDYRLANVRVRLNDGRYSAKKAVVEATQDYIDTQFNTSGIKAELSGRVNVDYHWIERLGESHAVSVAISLALVWLMAGLSFRSATAGTLALLPVLVTILMIYAVMGFTGIWLSISTSMFASIAIGLGVDFSIHTLERLQNLIRLQGQSMEQAVANLYPATGRALFFNFASLALGFGVLTVSKVVVLQDFGLLVAVAIATSFFSSMTLLPALAKVFKPHFLYGETASVSLIPPAGETQ
ncbi:MAG: efflux RND transporter permease subunit [Gammaproteobacteria bacterium]